MLERLKKMLAAGQDGALLRVSLGQAYLAAGNASLALEHLHKAVELKPDYSAAWKFLGKAYEAAAKPQTAADAYRRGIEVAEERGDQQLVREMRVYLRRIERPKPGLDR